MAHPLQVPEQARHVVVIIGGAVAGSEAAALCAERGILAVVIEQNDRPFGKIEDGLPRWHDKLRRKEYEHIGQNLSRPGVLYVPRTKLGRDLSIEHLTDAWGANAVLLASGAWRDRPLFPGIDVHLGRGVANQNALVYWYNHHHEQGYDGPQFELHDDAVVVGGGLASIDVVKIINFELYKRALAQHGVHTTTLELEHDGIPQFVEKHGLELEQLRVRGVTLYYRREKTAMPLASPPDHATPQQIEKNQQVRAKLMDKVIEKYLVRFQPNCAPLEPILEDGRFAGIRFQRTQTVDGRLLQKPGDTLDVRTPLVVSSIGSVPVALPGLPMKGELIDFEDWTTGKVRGLHNVFGLGNVLTGKGNIKESRKNAQEIGAQLVQSYLGLRNDAPLERELDQAHASAREQAQAALGVAEAQPLLSSERIANIYRDVAAHWARSGYEGSYAQWIERVTPQGDET
ncbi:MAG: dihydropyrimidine dehydrogenase subunit [Myxococcaceae bacterium]|nr:dihydropyrimidine dehydrogenase subunit [Myxococcaceae bacterium]